jgi:hypothetical protein
MSVSTRGSTARPNPYCSSLSTNCSSAWLYPGRRERTSILFGEDVRRADYGTLQPPPKSRPTGRSARPGGKRPRIEDRTQFFSSTSTKTIPSASAVTVWARPA